MDLLEKLPETIRVIALLVLQRGLEPRPLGRAPPESCPDGVAAVEIPAAAANHDRPQASLVVDRVVVVVLVQRVTTGFYLTEGFALLPQCRRPHAIRATVASLRPGPRPDENK